MHQLLPEFIMRPSVTSIKANRHGAICSNNLEHTADIASCERKNCTNLSQLSQRNEKNSSFHPEITKMTQI